MSDSSYRLSVELVVQGILVGCKKVPESDEKIINNQKLINSDLTLSWNLILIYFKNSLFRFSIKWDCESRFYYDHHPDHPWHFQNYISRTAMLEPYWGGNGQYHIVHIIWSILYGPYYMIYGPYLMVFNTNSRPWKSKGQGNYDS